MTRVLVSVLTLLSMFGLTACEAIEQKSTARLAVDVTISQALIGQMPDRGLDGRLLLILAEDGGTEPRFQASNSTNPSSGVQVFGQTFEDAQATETLSFAPETFGFPVASFADLPSGEYYAQAVFHRYETFTLSNGKTVKLPMNRGAGQNWRRAPGNLLSTPVKISIPEGGASEISLELTAMNPPIERPADTKYVKHIQIESKLLSEFWGRPIMLGAHVLLPEGFDQNPDQKYPLAVFHGHFPDDFSGFQEEPTAPDLECVDSARFQVPCYNKFVQDEANDFYKKWTSKDHPRMLIVEIQHANPYYDDSYAVNSANIGPYGDAITYELIPHIEEQFRGIGEGWARFLYGGSTGGWEALAAQVFYPDEYNGAFAACPDPIDFRAYVTVDIYKDENAYFIEGPFNRIARPGRRDYLGHVSSTMEMMNHYELVIGDKNRSGDQFDIWEAVYSPNGADGYPVPLWDKKTGVIDKGVADYWRENYDLRHIMERDWATLGPKLKGKIHLYTGDMDNYYLNNAVYLTEDFLERADPAYEGLVEYGDRAEHCWNGDHDNPNHVSRLRYNSFYLPRIMERIRATAPEGADLSFMNGMAGTRTE